MIVTKGPGDFFCLSQVPSTARKWVQFNIPQEYRYFDKEEEIGHWYVHHKYLLEVIELAYKNSGQVDYSSLDDYLQVEIAREKENWKVNQSSSNTERFKTSSPLSIIEAYATLHLLPSASSSLVSAAWRCLAKASHPDRGGDAELFRKYNEAYSKIVEEEKK